MTDDIATCSQCGKTRPHTIARLNRPGRPVCPPKAQDRSGCTPYPWKIEKLTPAQRAADLDAMQAWAARDEAARA